MTMETLQFGATFTLLHYYYFYIIRLLLFLHYYIIIIFTLLHYHIKVSNDEGDSPVWRHLYSASTNLGLKGVGPQDWMEVYMIYMNTLKIFIPQD